MPTLVTGGGVIGSRLAVYLSQIGEDVTVVEEDRKKCEWISKNSDAKVYNGSALDPDLLMQAGIDKADTLIVAMGNDQLTRKVVDLAKKQFGIPKVFAITRESEHSDQIRSSGANRVICAQDEVLDEAKRALNSGADRMIYHDVQRGCLISRATLRATSSAIGKPISKFQNKSARISGLIRDGNLMFPFEDTTLEMGDELFIIGMQDDVEEVVRVLSEES
ncbi:MAG: TrkA family potassium uptake protein [Thaumarchaeota archaeon]|nr:TrkA family potassium uptake protein [Nitrososphaerota archaeon]